MYFANTPMVFKAVNPTDITADNACESILEWLEKRFGHNDPLVHSQEVYHVWEGRPHGVWRHHIAAKKGGNSLYLQPHALSGTCNGVQIIQDNNSQ